MPQLRLLGPVQLLVDGAALPLAIRKTQALLLLLAREGPSGRERLCAWLWPALDEPTGRRNLRREIARLREAAGSALLVADGDRLRLADEVQVDHAAFLAALQAGQPDTALALWRGPLADGLRLDDAAPFEDWLARQRAQVQAQYAQALEASAAASEAAGRLPQALQRVMQLLDEDALQEQRHRDAMRLLAATGRREAALQQFDRCRALLQHELGLAPMAETVALWRQLRTEAGEPVPAAAPAPTTPLPTALPDLLAAQLAAPLPMAGRDGERQRLAAGWAQGHTLLIEGAGGVGKTRLALDLVEQQGPHLLVRARPGDGQTAYATFATGLRALLGPTPQAELSRLPPWVTAELARLLPELGAAPPPLQSDAERLRFTEACCQAWFALAGDNFDAVVFDDWHLADGASRSLVATLAARRQEGPVRTPREVLVMRPADEHPPLADWLAAARESLPCTAVKLPPLDGPAVLQIVRQLSAAPNPARFAARLTQATGGNPFFLVQTLRHLAETGLLGLGADGSWQTPFDADTHDYRELPLPASVRDAVLARVARLGDAARRMLEAAALAAEPFAPALLAPACALSELDGVLALDEAATAQLLRSHELGGYAFAHDLVQQALQAALPDERRRLLHHRLALAAEASAPAQAARHFEACGQPARAVPHRLAAGRAAQALHDLEGADAHWRQGLADGPTVAQRAALLTQRVGVLLSLDRGTELAEDAQALQALLQHPELDAPTRDAAALALVDMLINSHQGERAMGLMDGLSPDIRHRQHGALLRLRSLAQILVGRIEQARETVRGALALPGATTLERAALHKALALAEHAAGHMAVAENEVRQAVDLYQQAGDEASLCNMCYLHGSTLMNLGRLDEAERALVAATEQAGRQGYIQVQRRALYNLCAVHSAQSRPRAVLAAAHRGLALQGSGSHPGLTVMFHVAFVEAHVSLGEWGQALVHARAGLAGAGVLATLDELVNMVMTAQEMLAMVGAGAEVEAALARVPADWLAQMGYLASEFWVIQAEMALILGQPGMAEEQLRQAPADDTVEMPRMRQRARLARAAVQLALGHPQAAWNGLPADGEPGMNDELRQRCLATRLHAAQQLGRLDAALLEAATQALADPAAHALAALHLHRALAQVAPDRGADAAQAFVAGLAASLQGHPAEQAHLLARLQPDLTPLRH